jgi:hypothetical protein
MVVRPKHVAVLVVKLTYDSDVDPDLTHTTGCKHPGLSLFIRCIRSSRFCFIVIPISLYRVWKVLGSKLCQFIDFLELLFLRFFNEMAGRWLKITQR